MRRIPFCLVVPFVLACGLVGPGEPTIRLEGTVTSADNGSPIDSVGIFVHFTEHFLSFHGTTAARATTDATGRYALSFGTEGRCKAYTLTASATIHFASQSRRGAAGIRCTDKVQTFDFQLEHHAHAESGPFGGLRE